MNSILCHNCTDEYNAKYYTKRLSASEMAFSLPHSGACKRCEAHLYGTQFCLGCAIEHSICQGCGETKNTYLPESLRATVIASRARFDSAKQGIAAIYQQNIASFENQVTQYEAAIESSKQQLDADVAPSHEAHQAAVTAYNEAITVPNKDRKVIAEAYRASEKADRLCQEAWSAAREAQQKRNAQAKENFAFYEVYAFALNTRRNALGVVTAAFSAEVARDLALYEAAQQHLSALSLAVSINKR
jgi:hypothetical protein